jgi:hypothetical protein
MKRVLSVLLMLAMMTSTLPGSESGWARVLKLGSGSKVTVEVRGESPAPHYFVGATADAITLLDLDSAALPAHAQRFVIDIAGRRPDLFASSKGEYIEDGFRLTKDALFYRGTQVVELSAIVRTLAKDDIVEIVAPARGGSGTAIAAGVAAGIVGGMLIMPAFLFSRCNGSCAPNEIMAVLAMVGLPIAGGVLAAQGTRHGPETIYHS